MRTSWFVVAKVDVQTVVVETVVEETVVAETVVAETVVVETVVQLELLASAERLIAIVAHVSHVVQFRVVVQFA